MYNVSISESKHKWNKKNLVTKSGKSGLYDELQCENCGIKARQYRLGVVSISESYKREKAFSCPTAPADLPKRVRVTKCTAQGNIFANLTPGSEHSVVEPPKGYANDHRGVWVQGVGEPVKLLSSEFNVIEK